MITRDLLNDLATITGDKALLNAFKIKNPEFVGFCEAIAARDLRDEKPIGSFPAMGDLTAIQIAVFQPSSHTIDVRTSGVAGVSRKRESSRPYPRTAEARTSRTTVAVSTTWERRVGV